MSTQALEGGYPLAIRAAAVLALASRAGLAFGAGDAEALASVVDRVASQVLAADAELRADPAAFAPAYLA